MLFQITNRALNKMQLDERTQAIYIKCRYRYGYPSFNVWVKLYSILRKSNLSCGRQPQHKTAAKYFLTFTFFHFYFCRICWPVACTLHTCKNTAKSFFSFTFYHLYGLKQTCLILSHFHFLPILFHDLIVWWAHAMFNSLILNVWIK